MRELRIFLGASFASGMSDPFLRFGVSWYVLKNTDSTALFAAMYGISSLLEAFARPFLAPLSDHFNRILVFRVCTALSTLMSVLLLLSVLFMPFSIGLLALILTGASLVAGLRDPTVQAIFPHLVEPSQLTKAASMRGMFNSLTMTGGPVLAGTVLALSSAQFTLAAATAMEVLSVMLAFSVRRNASLDSLSLKASWANFVGVWHLRVLEGMRSLWHNRAERTAAVTTTLIHSVYSAIIAVILPVWAMKQLGGSAASMAQMEFSLGVGMLLGSTLLLHQANGTLGRYAASVAGPILSGGALLSAGLVHHGILTMLCLGLVGAGFSIYFVNMAAVRAAATPPHFRSRLIGAFGFVVGCGGPVLMQASGTALERLSVSAVNALCAGVLVVGALIHARNKDSRTLLQKSDESIVGSYTDLYPKAFVEKHKS